MGYPQYHENSIASEGSIVTSLDMTYIRPVRLDAPADGHFAEFCGYMDSLKDRKVWVHWIVNARVSAFLSRYLQERYNFSALETATPLLLRWLPSMDEVWKELISLAPQQLEIG